METRLRRQPFLLSLLLVALLSACDTVTSIHPPGLRPAYTEPAEVSGTWFNKEAVLHVGALGEGRFLLVSPEWKQDRFVVHTVKGHFLRDDRFRYLSVVDPDTQEQDPPYYFVRAAMSDGGDLVYWMPRAEAFAKAVEDGRLEGSVTRGEYSVDVRLSGSAEAITGFLGAAPQHEFWELDQPHILKRLRP